VPSSVRSFVPRGAVRVYLIISGLRERVPAAGMHEAARGVVNCRSAVVTTHEPADGDKPARC
jgi:hypothetical protein